MTLFLLACASTPPPVDSSPPVDTAPAFDGLALLQERLSGVFDSSTQAATNPSYYDVSLTACEVDAGGLGEHVLYVEQAITSSLNAPYRQRLYVLSQDGDTYISTIYTLADEMNAVGLCGEDTLRVYTPQDVTLRQGCEVTMTWDGENFDGESGVDTCGSDLNGATYATSEVVVTEDRIESWDRGYDASGNQVWGATAGAYIFDRKE
jgi:hypothetical protein